MDVPDGLPKWSLLDGASNLIGDSAMEFVSEHESKRDAERMGAL